MSMICDDHDIMISAYHEKRVESSGTYTKGQTRVGPGLGFGWFLLVVNIILVATGIRMAIYAS